VLARRGQTEAAVDLTRLAGLTPGGVLCEVINDDGTMARGAQLQAFCHEHSLPIVTVEHIAGYVRSLALTASAV
jgi:3,4-dihydroxy-2-butanone 4-phosphate synthase